MSNHFVVHLKLILHVNCNWKFNFTNDSDYVSNYYISFNAVSALTRDPEASTSSPQHLHAKPLPLED